MTVLAVDIQKGITNERLYDHKAFVENTCRIISTARKNNVEVIYIRHDDGPGNALSAGNEEFEIAEQFSPAVDEKIFDKTINSCFGNEALRKYLEEKQEKTLIIVGLQTDYCIDATVKSAFERGYKVIIPEGTNSTFDNRYMDKETTYRYFNEMMWPGRYAECLSVEKAVSVIEGMK